MTPASVSMDLWLLIPPMHEVHVTRGVLSGLSDPRFANRSRYQHFSPGWK